MIHANPKRPPRATIFRSEVSRCALLTPDKRQCRGRERRPPQPATRSARRNQLAALRFTPLRTATVDSFLSAAFSSFRFVVSRRMTSSRPSASPRRSACRSARSRSARRIARRRRSRHPALPCRRPRPRLHPLRLMRPSMAGHFTPCGFSPIFWKTWSRRVIWFLVSSR